MYRKRSLQHSRKQQNITPYAVIKVQESDVDIYKEKNLQFVILAKYKKTEII